MYRIYYGDKIVYDPFSPDEHAYSVTCYGGINDKGDMNLTVPYNHPLYNDFKIRDLEMSLIHDGENIFTGYITQIEKDFELNLIIKCSGIMGYLGDVLLPPYTTDEREIEDDMELATSGLEGLFQWYIDKYNERSGHPFQIGINKVSSVSLTESIYRSNSSYSTVADEIESKLIDTVGGYLYARKVHNVNYLDYLNDVTEVNSQIIDFGVNILDYTYTEDSSDLYSAVVVPGHKYKTESGKEKEVHISETFAEVYGEFSIDGNVIISKDSYEKYGYRETIYENTDASTGQELYESACAYLRQVCKPSTMVIVKAVDLSLYMDKYKHLTPGEIVRVRSKVHGIDEYLVVTQMDIDLDDPGNTEYTLGVVYDTLTGEESSKLRDLNTNLDRTVDEVDSLGQDVLDNAEHLDELQKRFEATEFERSEFEEQIRESILDLKKIADGAIETWFYPYSPTMDNLPASEWKTDDDKYNHIGDLFYNTETGKAFRFMYEANSQGDMVYSWGPIVDTDIEAALREASIAKDTADSKRRVFYETPYPPYDEGDLWAQGATGDILVSKKDQRTKFDPDDWVYAAKYAKAIYSTEEQFYQSTSPDVLEGGMWGPYNNWEEGKYTWRRTLVTYGDGSTSWEPSETGVCISGNDGSDGTDGNGVSSIVRYYLATNLSSGVNVNTPGWSETIQTMTAEKPYLWSYQKTYFTLGDPETTTPVIIGHYGENGEDGISVESITEYYLIASVKEGITRGSAGWSTEVPTMTSTLKYLWNYKATKYSNGITKYTDPVIIGVYGDKGSDGKDGSNGEAIFGTCDDSESTTVKRCNNAEGFTVLEDGIVVTIYFKYRNTANYPKLNVNGSGDIPIMTNGVNFAYWSAGQAVMFVYYKSENAWYVASHPVWATEETIGNPLSKNVYINGTGINLRTGTTVNSSFTADTISLGSSNMSSTIQFCNDSARITSKYTRAIELPSVDQRLVSITSGTLSETYSGIKMEAISNCTNGGYSQIQLSSGYSNSDVKGSMALKSGANINLEAGETIRLIGSGGSANIGSVDIRGTNGSRIDLYNGRLLLNGRPTGNSFAAITAYTSSDITLPKLTSDSNMSSMRIQMSYYTATNNLYYSLSNGGVAITDPGYYEISGQAGIELGSVQSDQGICVSLVYRTSSGTTTSWSGVNYISQTKIWKAPSQNINITLAPKIISVTSSAYVYLVGRYSGTTITATALADPYTYFTIRRVG